MSRQREITRPTVLLDADGRLAQPGWARRMLYLYNRHRVHAPPFSLKEWDFYQLALDDSHVLQMTIGHVSYMASFSATLFNLKSGQRYGFSRMRPLPGRGLAMPLSPDQPHHLAVGGRGWRMNFLVGEADRRLTLEAGRRAGDVSIDLTLPRRAGDEKMVIATPFGQPGRFYLNCKEHYYGLTGRARFGAVAVEAKGRTTGLLDWGRGVWPFHQEWFWGCGSAFVPGGRFGFNIGWGFGDLTRATENVFFWNGRAHKLGTLRVERDAQNYLAPWRFTDAAGRFDLVMKPTYDNYTTTKLAFVDNRCHQVFGIFHGRVVLEDGSVMEIRDFPAFCEHAINNW